MVIMIYFDNDADEHEDCDKYSIKDNNINANGFDNYHVDFNDDSSDSSRDDDGLSVTGGF
jgi:hypothetical protein